MPPVVNLTPTPIPRLEFRAAILQDFLVNAEIPPDIVKRAVDGFFAGDLTGVTVYAMDANNWAQEHATLQFSDVFENDTLTVDVSGGRSMIEAASVRFSRCVEHSLRRMKIQGYRLSWNFHMRTFPTQAGFEGALRRYNLVPGEPPRYAHGTGPRQLFSVSPGLDQGISYAHYTARPIR